MGTVFSIDVRAPGVDDAAVDAAVAALHHADETFSTYRPDSVISRLAACTLRLDDADADVRAVLAMCTDLTERTGGYFSAYANGKLDPSGYVKGWAIERASAILAEAGSRNHCINGGGDVQCIGAAAPGTAWRIGIAHPLRAGVLIGTVPGAGSFAVATSGTAERGAHVLDPHTRSPAGELASVTVVGSNLAEVDALATAAMAMGRAAHDWIEDLGLRALVVSADGTVWRSTSGWIPDEA